MLNLEIGSRHIKGDGPELRKLFENIDHKLNYSKISKKLFKIKKKIIINLFLVSSSRHIEGDSRVLRKLFKSIDSELNYSKLSKQPCKIIKKIIL